MFVYWEGVKMPKRMCNFENCNKIIPFKKRYCEEHEKIKKFQLREHNKRYLNERSDTKEQDFYKKKEWKIKRATILQRDNYLCQHCLKEMIFTPADLVHHIIDIKVDWSKRLEDENLISLCVGCHNAIHNKDRARGGGH